MFENMDDTVVAISSPAGSGLLGVVRLSGPDALVIGDGLFRAHCDVRIRDVDQNTRLHGYAATEANAFCLPAQAVVFRAPRSYTRENVLELHTTGAAAALALIVELATALGARQAAPGEFTARAYFHGAMDLTQAEGVAALINARSDQQLRSAHRWLDGNLARELRRVREQLADLISLVEADIDFAEEPIEFIAPAQLLPRVQQLDCVLEGLIQHADATALTHDLPRVLLVGPPNAGKSTLINRLSGMSRAICSAVEGTTRDFLSAVVSLAGGEIEVIDTPGWAQNEGKIEKKSKFFFEREIAHVDLVCRVFDVAADVKPELGLQGLNIGVERTLWVATKCDVLSAEQLATTCARLSKKLAAPMCAVSAHAQTGIAGLTQALNERLFCESHAIGEQRVAISIAHRATLHNALDALRRAQLWCTRSDNTLDSAEWLATDLRSALREVGSILGDVTTEDLLERIFAEFCIGK